VLSRARAATVLALLLGLQPVTTDVYLPALPALARDLAAPMPAVQLTMSALILAFGLAQLVWGPVADRVGRRPVLLTGLGLYTLASVAAALAGDIAWLVGWRALQGAALAAAVVCARAIVRDLYEPVQGAQVMSLALSGLGVIAIAGPLLGGVATALGGWRVALAGVAACGAAALAVVAWGLPETLARRNPRATRPAPLLRAWRGIGMHPVFMAWTALISCSYGGLFTVLAGSSFVYIGVLGLPATGYGLALATGSLAYVAGTFACRRWVARHGPGGAVRVAAGFTLAGGALTALAAWVVGGTDAMGVAGTWTAGHPAPAAAVFAFLVPQWLYCFGHGVHQPCGQAGAVGPFPHAAGTASALAGFVLAATAFGVGLWLGRALAGDAGAVVAAYGAGVAFWSLLTAAVAWTLVQRLPR
jgi:DHA1 family bicyclomycin/chloramphenicol resistance-like MFS transporter